jgi:hypothetical protein
MPTRVPGWGEKFSAIQTMASISYSFSSTSNGMIKRASRRPPTTSARQRFVLGTSAHDGHQHRDAIRAFWSSSVGLRSFALPCISSAQAVGGSDALRTASRSLFRSRFVPLFSPEGLRTGRQGKRPSNPGAHAHQFHIHMGAAVSDLF